MCENTGHLVDQQCFARFCCLLMFKLIRQNIIFFKQHKFQTRNVLQRALQRAFQPAGCVFKPTPSRVSTQMDVSVVDKVPS